MEGGGVCAVDADDGRAVVGEHHAREGACGGSGAVRMYGEIRRTSWYVPGARPANSRTRMPVNGGGEWAIASQRCRDVESG